MMEGEHAADLAKPDHKFFGKHRWRGRLFSNEDRTSKNNEHEVRQVNDIVEFLQTPADRERPIGQDRLTTLSDESSRLPSASVGSDPTLQSLSDSPHKQPRRKGLRVTFDTATPEIIGEGGDEAVLPAIQVRKSRLPSNRLHQPNEHDAIRYPRRASPTVEHAPNLRWSLRQGDHTESDSDDAQAFTFPPLRRQSTGFHDLEQETERLSLTSDVDPDDELSTKLRNREDSMTSPGSDDNPEPFDMVYSSYFQDSIPSPKIIVDQPSSQGDRELLEHGGNLAGLRSFSSLKSSSPDLDISLGNSLTPIPTQQPLSSQAALSSSYNFPNATSTDRSPSRAESTQRRREESALDDSVETKTSQSSSSSAAKKSAPISLRSVAKGLGEDAFNEFLTRVRRFSALFRLGVAANRSFESISFMQWMRAGAWWFLKGRGELENAVRGRPKSRDRIGNLTESELSKELKQAYMNLAKTCWILTEVAPAHEELKRYGNASIETLSPLVRSFGDSKLAELLELHRAIIANLRALTMSMKRNNKMPPNDFEPQGLDSRIWIETPRFAPGVSGMLAGSSSRGLLESGSVGLDAFPYPVGDTSHHFNYGSMFVDVRLESSVDRHGGLHVPCILTILRPKAARDLEVVLANQDGQINLIIQSDRQAGPTWRNAQWKTKDYVILLNLPDGLTLNIQFEETSFRSLWGVYDYTRKVRKEMEAEESEELVFGSVVHCVHYVDSPNAKAFPSDPTRSCEVLLFEKVLQSAEGTGRRRFYNGHRLVIVTPSSSKTLSSINRDFGKQKPILFTYVRGEDAGPAILLKIDVAGSTLVITFIDASARDHFQTLLDGTLLKADESCTESMALKAVDINTLGGGSATISRSFLSDWQWQKLRVINRRPEYFDSRLTRTVLSENLRLWVQCGAGAFVDRINLGMAREIPTIL